VICQFVTTDAEVIVVPAFGSFCKDQSVELFSLRCYRTQSKRKATNCLASTPLYIDHSFTALQLIRAQYVYKRERERPLRRSQELPEDTDLYRLIQLELHYF